MIRQKSEYVCSQCGGKSLKFAGYCPKCNAAGTMQEHIIIPVKVKPIENASQKSVRRRWKNSERDGAREMRDADGPDPAFKNITSSTGKVGHITGMQIDAVSRTYVIENKNTNLPIWIIKAWVQLLQKGVDFNKEVLLRMDPPNLPKQFIVNGIKRKTDVIAMITQTRHKELVVMARQIDEIREVVDSGLALSPTNKVKKIRDILNLN